MSNVHFFPLVTNDGGGSGPEDPMLERRVDTLEADMKDVKASLNRLELGFARIEDKFAYLVTKEDLARVEMRLGAEVARVETKLSAEIIRVESKIGNEMVELKGRMAGVEGRMTGLSDRVAGLPTFWTHFTVTLATWGLGSGLLIFALTRLLAK